MRPFAEVGKRMCATWWMVGPFERREDKLRRTSRHRPRDRWAGHFSGEPLSNAVASFGGNGAGRSLTARLHFGPRRREDGGLETAAMAGEARVELCAVRNGSIKPTATKRKRTEPDVGDRF
jgi:hypothetical protein